MEKSSNLLHLLLYYRLLNCFAEKIDQLFCLEYNHLPHLTKVSLHARHAFLSLPMILHLFWQCFWIFHL